jgi:hypothetical protein
MASIGQMEAWKYDPWFAAKRSHLRRNAKHRCHWSDFSLARFDFDLCRAISTYAMQIRLMYAMRFRLMSCEFHLCYAISTYAMRFRLMPCDFDLCHAILTYAMWFLVTQSTKSKASHELNSPEQNARCSGWNRLSVNDAEEANEAKILSMQKRGKKENSVSGQMTPLNRVTRDQCYHF